MVEVLVAVVIIGTVLVVMGATMYTAFGSIGFSRQRDTATQLANQAMEQIKAMNFNDLLMAVSDINTDALITCASGGVAPCTFGSSPARTIPTVTSGTIPPSPLNPHVSTTTPPGGVSVYTVASYVTFDGTGNTQARVATVRVTWTHPVRGTNALVQIESTIFANSSVPCNNCGHAWTAQALDTPGNISVTGTLVGTSLANIAFGPGSTTANIAVDGTASANGTVAASTLQLLGQTLLTTNQSTSSASSAPGQGLSAPSATVVNNSSVLGPQAGAGVLALVNLILQLVGGQIGMTGPAGVTATTRAMAANSAAGAANVSNGSGGTGTMPNSSLPYAQALAQQTGPVSLGVTLTTAGLLPQNLSIIQLTPLGNSNPDLATVCQQTTSGAGCSPGSAIPVTGNVSGVSQPSYAGAAIEAQAQKSFSQITVLPLAGTPLLDITGFTAAASAAAGPGISNTAKAGVSALTVKLNGTAVPLGNLVAGVSGSATASLGLLGTANVGVTLKFGSTTTSGNTATITSPLTLTVTVTLGSLLNLTANVTFGSVSATANYS